MGWRNENHPVKKIVSVLQYKTIGFAQRFLLYKTIGFAQRFLLYMAIGSALLAVREIGHQEHEVEKAWFQGREQEYAMFTERLRMLKAL